MKIRCAWSLWMLAYLNPTVLGSMMLPEGDQELKEVRMCSRPGRPSFTGGAESTSMSRPSFASDPGFPADGKLPAPGAERRGKEDTEEPPAGEAGPTGPHTHHGSDEPAAGDSASSTSKDADSRIGGHELGPALESRSPVLDISGHASALKGLRLDTALDGEMSNKAQMIELPSPRPQNKKLESKFKESQSQARGRVVVSKQTSISDLKSEPSGDPSEKGKDNRLSVKVAKRRKAILNKRKKGRHKRFVKMKNALDESAENVPVDFGEEVDSMKRLLGDENGQGLAHNLGRKSLEEGTASTTFNTISQVFTIGKGVQDRIWACASMLWEDVPGRVINEAVQNGKGFASAVEKAISSTDFLSYVQQSSHKPQRESVTVSLHCDLEEFSNALWAVNFQILELLGAENQPSLSLQEQFSIQEWVLQNLSIDQDKKVIECFDEGHHQAYVAPRQTNIRDSFFQYLLSDEKVIVFHVPSSTFEGSDLAVSERDILLIKLIVNILGNYYKTQNQGKWIRVFQDDESFLAKLITNKINRKTHSAIKHFLNDNMSSLIPWKRQSESHSSQVKSPLEVARDSWILETLLNNVRMPDHQDQGILGPTTRSLSPLQVGNTRGFNMVKEDPKLWAWITMIKSHGIKMKKEEYEFKTNLWEHQLVNDLRKKLNPAQNHEEITLPLILELIDEIKEFSNLLWLFNSRLLRFYQTHESIHDYLAEQKSVQEFFLSTFNSKTHSNVPQYLDQGLLKKHSILKNLVIKSILSTKRSPVYQSTKYMPLSTLSRIQILKISEKEIQMTEAVVHLLGSYYKLINPGKWKDVFKEDDQFLTIFSTIQHQLFLEKSSKSFNRYSSIFTEPLKINLIPWATDLYNHGQMDHHVKSEEFDFPSGALSRKELNDWIRNYVVECY
ncbi:hypothetical protein PGT21_032493 [Puccinia graminis f. sp. tritici]|uniref:Uncharacterized protein n=1 Tax=Puccinia graminis f. sp. tritici TaxID=56615 RepID=A0A5B0Q7F1_PUCGR|nr:hypothetical protein PGT21_032493 [Puccinia graminis f. sp. tritici]